MYIAICLYIHIHIYIYIYACVDVITSVFRLTLHELSEYLGFTLCLIASGCGVQVLMFVHPCRVLGSHSSHLLFAAENWNSWKVGPNLFLEDLQTISTYVRILSPYFHLYFTYHVHHRFRYIFYFQTCSQCFHTCSPYFRTCSPLFQWLLILRPSLDGPFPRTAKR